MKKMRGDRLTYFFDASIYASYCVTSGAYTVIACGMFGEAKGGPNSRTGGLLANLTSPRTGQGQDLSHMGYLVQIPEQVQESLNPCLGENIAGQNTELFLQLSIG